MFKINNNYFFLSLKKKLSKIENFSKKNVLFLTITSLELVVISYLYVQLAHWRKQVRISFIKNEYIVKPSDSLKNYFEYLSNTKIADKQSWLSYIPVYNMNLDGLNERYDYYPQESNVFRIIALGDSFTFGYLVNTADSYPEQLEDLVNNKSLCNSRDKIEVINLGIPGYDIQFASERYRRKGQKYKPDLIVWFVKEDDFIDIAEITEPKVEYYRKNKDRIGELNNKGYTNPEFYKAIDDIIKELGKDKILKLQKGFLESFRNFYKGDLVIVTYDDANKLKFRYTDMVKEFVSHHPRTYYYDEIPRIDQIDGLHLADNHPNKEGYKILSRYIFNYLKSQSLIPCS